MTRIISPVIYLVTPFAAIWLFLAGSSRGESAKGSWDSQFVLPPGLNGSVFAMASMGNDLYVAGQFTKAGDTPANGIAKWNGTNWSTLGSGVDGTVFALATNGGNLFAGGQFRQAGGVMATNIAKWNGTNWSELAGGVDEGFYNPGVQCLYSQGTNLYVGGAFFRAGSNYVENIARWDGVTWHSMDTGLSLPAEYPYTEGWVAAITGDGTNIYAGGVFIQAGSIGATNLARWNGTSWESVGDCTGGGFGIIYQGSPHYGIVGALTFHNGYLYVSGQFDRVSANLITNFARWNGNNWESPGSVDGVVTHFESWSGNLYVSGVFQKIGRISATNLAVLANDNWMPLDLMVPGYEAIISSKHVGSDFYVGGNFNLANGISAGNLVRYDGTNWTTIGNGVGNSLGGYSSSLATDGTNVYAAGMFWTAGTNPVSCLAKWDGTNWSGVGTVFSGYLTKVAVAGLNVFVSGNFQIPEAGATNLACWDGSEWLSLGRSFDMYNDLLAVGGKLYTSGYCYNPDDQTWTAIPEFGTNQFYEFRLATDQTNIFLAASGPTGGRIGKWNGTSLEDLPTPSFVSAQALAVSRTNLFLLGYRWDDNYNSVPELLEWDGATWSEINFPSSGSISTIVPTADGVYFGGYFDVVDGISTHGVVQWRDGKWLSLGSGVTLGEHTGSVGSMVLLKRKLFVAGDFTGAGGNDSGHFALWTETPEIRLEDFHLKPDGAPAFNVVGLPGDEIGIEVSTNFLTWMGIDSIHLDSPKQEFSESLMPVPPVSRFYRAKFIR